MSALNDLLAQRQYALNAWLSGSTPTGAPRWVGDDGRRLTEASVATSGVVIQTAWAAKVAEQDAVFRTARAAAGIVPTVAELGVEISVEAERRKDAGTLINGIQFRCDDKSLTRLQGMVKRAANAENAGEPFSQKFRTSAGVTVTITTLAQAQAIENAAGDFAGFILSRSAELQESVAAMSAAQRATFNPADNAHWS